MSNKGNEKADTAKRNGTILKEICGGEKQGARDETRTEACERYVTAGDRWLDSVIRQSKRMDTPSDTREASEGTRTNA